MLVLEYNEFMIKTGLERPVNDNGSSTVGKLAGADGGFYNIYDRKLVFLIYVKILMVANEDS